MNDLDFTGERIVPGKSPASLVAEHIARYKFALEYVKGLKVLDLGCGEGYGSNILLSSAKSVTGVDLSPEAIGHASENYRAENLKFVVGDAGKLPFEDAEFDAIVCFEVFEHVENPVELLKESRRLLKPKGKLLLSTPNGAVKVSSKPNPYHFNEYTEREFTDLIRGEFRESSWDILILGQFLKDKYYSGITVGLKNLYLSIKGTLAGGKIETKKVEHEATGSRSKEEYEFLSERVNLAEYLIAIVVGRG
ncbi:MAG: class I SAM-dependent methyltransferase [bacterium]